MNWEEQYASITAPTKGVLIFQEQIMELFHKVAGFSLEDAYVALKAIGKKSAELMSSFKQQFLDGSIANGVPSRDAEDLWQTVTVFAGYAFNKSHSVAYSHLTYATAYLKANNPAAFYAACLKNYSQPADRCRFAAEARAAGLSIKAPHVNKGEVDWSVDGNTIYVGLSRAVGEKAAAAIVAARPFTSILDLRERVPGKILNTRKLKQLYLSGCLTGLGSMALAEVPPAQMKTRKFKQSLLDSPRDWFEDTWVEPYQAAEAEYELFGTWLSWHPLENEPSGSCLGFAEDHEGTMCLRGAIATVKTRTIKNGQTMADLLFEGRDGSVPVTVFGRSWERDGDKLTVGSVHSLILKAEVSNEGVEYLYSRIGELEVVTITCPLDRVKELKELLAAQTPGKVQVNVRLGDKIKSGAAAVSSSSTLERRLRHANFDYSRM